MKGDEMKSTKKVKVIIKISDALYKMIKIICKTQKISMSLFVERAIKNYLKEKEKDNGYV